MRWNKYAVSLASPELSSTRRTRSESTFSVNELNVPRFSTAMSSNRYVEESDEYFSVRSRSLYRPSVCLSSVVCNVRAPHLAGVNFRQIFYAIWYLGHPLTVTENFTEIVPKEPLRRGFKRKRGSQIWRFLTCRRLYLAKGEK